MNCADTVYAGPELEGEAIDPLYERWITGLGLTDINIFPHFQSLKDDYLDGLRLIEDITYADSIGHEIIALNDGSPIYKLFQNSLQFRLRERFGICYNHGGA